jgi:hypothetical protein
VITRARARRSRAGGVVLIVIGTVLLIGGPILGVVTGGLAMIPAGLDLAENTRSVQPETSIALENGKQLYLLAPAAQLSQVSDQDCAADVSGIQVEIRSEPAGTLRTFVHDTAYKSFASFIAPRAGDYTISCDTTVPLVTAPPFSLLGLFGPFLWLTLTGIGLGIGGLATIIIGIVRVIRVLGSPRDAVQMASQAWAAEAMNSTEVAVS